jgi:hypothetical protein
MPRSELIALTDDAAHTRGLATYFHINGIDTIAISASKSYATNRAWLEQRIGRPLSRREAWRSWLIETFTPSVSQSQGADAKFGVSGELPYLFSSQDAYSTVTFEVPMSCYKSDAVRALLVALPSKRDPHTDYGCYLQLTTTYIEGMAMIDYNCAYDSPFYQNEQRELNKQIVAACPGAVQRYVNTPSAFLTPRDYFPNYDALAAIKTVWDPDETFRVYQGVRPTGKAPDSYEWRRDYKRTKTCTEWMQEKTWDVMVRFVF